MLHLLDTNVLIEANRLYYPIDRIPQFWLWLEQRANKDQIKIPFEVMREIERGHKDDNLLTWVRDNRARLQLDEELNRACWTRTIGKDTNSLAATIKQFLAKARIHF